jgi:serine/threonine protein kinase
VQTDIYSLGAILYELIAGRLPLRRRDRTRSAAPRRAGSPSRVRTLDPRVPKDLDAICLKCLQREPSSRYNSAAALAAISSVS